MLSSCPDTMPRTSTGSPFMSPLVFGNCTATRLLLDPRLNSLNQSTPQMSTAMDSRNAIPTWISCFRDDAIAVNGFDNRFSYGFEDGDFGRRLEMRGITPKTVRWTANVLHLWHAKPWADPETMLRNREMMDENVALRRHRAISGLDELEHAAD